MTTSRSGPPTLASKLRPRSLKTWITLAFSARTSARNRFRPVLRAWETRCSISVVARVQRDRRRNLEGAGGVRRLGHRRVGPGRQADRAAERAVEELSTAFSGFLRLTLGGDGQQPVVRGHGDVLLRVEAGQLGPH